MSESNLLYFVLVYIFYLQQIVVQSSDISHNADHNYTNQNVAMQVCKKISDICVGSYCIKNETFDCLDIPNSILLCDYFGTIKSLLTCYCVENDGDKIIIGSCIYTCHSNILQYIILPTDKTEWNKMMCDKFNRKGPLCGQCKDNYYVPVYSYDVTCVTCADTNDWWKFILVAFFPLTVFYSTVLVFKVNIHSSYLQGYVHYCQAVTVFPLARNLYRIASNSSIMIKYPIYIMGTIYGIWNLDFFRFFSPHICLRTNTLGTTTLDFVVAAYPIMLLLLTYILIKAYDKNMKLVVLLWKPFQKLLKPFEKSWSAKTSLIDSFSTFYFLLSVKSINVCLDLLLPVQTYALSSDGVTSTYRLYYDASLSYFERSHIPCAIFALFIVFLVGFLPTFLLFLYPFNFFQHLLFYLPQTWRISIKIFVDTIQCCYKDGTEKGTRDYRWLSSFVFGSRVTFAIIYGLTLNSSFFIITAIILTIFVMIFIIVNPYKDKYKNLNTSTTIYLILLVSFCIVGDVYDRYIHLGATIYVILFILCVMPLIYTCILSICYIYRHSNNGRSLFRHYLNQNTV